MSDYDDLTSVLEYAYQPLGLGVASKVIGGIGDVMEKYRQRARKKQIAEALSKGENIGINKLLESEDLEWDKVLDLIKWGVESQQRKNAMKSIEQSGRQVYPKAITSSGEISYGVETPAQEKRRQLETVGEVLRNRIAETKSRLSSLPEIGANPVTVSKLQEQALGDVEALRGISPAVRVPKFEVPKQPQEFTRPITREETSKKKVGLLDQILEGTEGTQTSPYPEYPDAFQEDGTWKVIRNGKRYRIED